MKTCVYQGVEGSYSSLAAARWKEGLHLMGKPSFRGVFEILLKVDYGVIPLENSLAGSIHENYDLLHEFPVAIVGEIYQKVDHCLMGKCEDPRHITKVFSHPKALEQCTQFFKNCPWLEPIACFDTAGAAQMIALQQNPELGAIASRQAAELYGLHILQENIQDFQDNTTRFAVIARQKAEMQAGLNKSSWMLQLPHTRGALARVLQIFADQGMNLTKIESRPMKTAPFEYIFYIDCEGSGVNELRPLLQPHVHVVHLLGHYAAGHI